MPPDKDIDRELRDLAPRVEYPPTPDIARSVRDRLEAGEGPAGSRSRTRPQLWWIAAAALVLLASVPVFSLAMREIGGVSSAGGGAVGGTAESGRRGPGAGQTRSMEDAAAEPTHVAQSEGDLAAGAGESSSGASGSDEAACGSPMPVIEARPARGEPGDTFRVTGTYFFANSGGCDIDPVRDVRLVFLQGGETWDLGRVVPDKDARIFAQLEVPAGARAGRATVRATYGQGPPEAPHGRVSAETRFSVLD